MKAIAKTTGSFELYDASIRDHVTCYHAKVVTWTNFFESRTGRGQIKVLAANLPMEANDADFQKYLEDSESEDLAVAAYVSSFELSDREKLEARAQELGITVRSNMKDETLVSKIAEAEGE